jgi:hypothetical protein
MKIIRLFNKLALSAVMAMMMVNPSFASDEEGMDGFVHLVAANDVIVKTHDWVNVPKTLKYEQLQHLKEKKLVIDQIHLTRDGSALSDNLPGNWRKITNAVYNNKIAHLLREYRYEGDHPSTFYADYHVENWFDFSVMGQDASLLNSSIVIITDLDEEAAEPAPISTLDFGYNSPAASHIRLPAEVLDFIKQQMFLNSFEVGGPSAAKAAVANAGKHVISFVLKSQIKKNPYAALVHAPLELVAKTIGYSTVTHMFADLIQHRKLTTEFLNTKTDAAHRLELKHQRATAFSRAAGCVVRFIPFVSPVRTILTMLVNRKGYSTLTHFGLRYRDLSPSEIAEHKTVAKLAEGGVALLVETFVPCGAVIVGVSQAGAGLILGESSLTSAAIKKLAGTPKKDDK